VSPLRKSGAEHHRTLSHLPQSVPLLSAPAARVIISWWGREVHIWSLQRRFEELLDEVETETDVDRQRKLLGRILIKGNYDITSAAVSQDGSLLVVSTTSETKAFQLRQPGSASEQLRISKADLPEGIASRGATQVAVSPDGGWICSAQAPDSLTIVEVAGSQGDGKPSANSKALRLRRLRRDIPKHVTLGGLGSYDRNITRITFSADSKVLAASDLAGYIDTWVLRGRPGSLRNGTASEEDDASSSSSSSSSSSDEPEDDAPAKRGPCWIRNPAARLLPKLPAGAVVLSFSPDTPGHIRPNGQGGGDYVLLAITSSSEVFAFHPLSGKLTAWSRWISRKNLPVEYRNTRDLAKGVVWQGPRLWIYGASFLFMIDTSIDPHEGRSVSVVASNSHNKRKRKRGTDTGAGNRMIHGALEPHHVRAEVDGEAEAKMRDVDMGDVEDGPGDSGDEDDSGSHDENPAMDIQGASAKADDEEPQPRRWWHTFKFRPILGLVPIGSAALASGLENGIADGSPPLEVALVECPTWDIDMPARQAGEDDWRQ